MERSNPHSVRQQGFTLIEMIMVVVITSIIGSMVALFLKSPIDQYMAVARRAELTDIADTAVRRMTRDVRIAAPNSVRTAGCGATQCVEFLPTTNGGRYRAAGLFDGSDTTFDIVGAATVAVGDFVVIGSTQSDGSIAYDEGVNGGLRKVTGVAGSKVTLASGVPSTAELESHRFAVVNGAQQQAVTYVCENVGTTDGNGTGELKRYWGYGFNAVQANPPGGSSALLADKVSACQFDYAVPNQRLGLLSVRLTLTSSNESVSLYHEIHVSNVP